MVFRRPAAGAAPGTSSVVAVGGQDGTVSVWLTGAARPLAVLHAAFQHPVADVAWVPSGVALLACSTDGSVLLLAFDPAELGAPLTPAELEQLRHAKFGDRRAARGLAESAGQARRAATLAAVSRQDLLGERANDRWEVGFLF